MNLVLFVERDLVSYVERDAQNQVKTKEIRSHGSLSAAGIAPATDSLPRYSVPLPTATVQVSTSQLIDVTVASRGRRSTNTSGQCNPIRPQINPNRPQTIIVSGQSKPILQLNTNLTSQNNPVGLQTTSVFGQSNQIITHNTNDIDTDLQSKIINGPDWSNQIRSLNFNLPPETYQIRTQTTNVSGQSHPLRSLHTNFTTKYNPAQSQIIINANRCNQISPLKAHPNFTAQPNQISPHATGASRQSNSVWPPNTNLTAQPNLINQPTSKVSSGHSNPIQPPDISSTSNSNFTPALQKAMNGIGHSESTPQLLSDVKPTCPVRSPTTDAAGHLSRQCPFQLSIVCRLCSALFDPKCAETTCCHGHDWQLYKTVQAAPGNVLVKPLPCWVPINLAKLSICRNINKKTPCNYPYPCQFAHSQMEKDVWIWQVNAEGW